MSQLAEEVAREIIKMTGDRQDARFLRLLDSWRPDFVLVIDKHLKPLVEAAENLQGIIDWLMEEAGKRMKQADARRTSPEQRNLTPKELKSAKRMAEKMAGHKLQHVSATVESNIAYLDMQDRIANKLEDEGRALAARADFLDRLRSELSRCK